jgi:hypothetical protein
MIAEWNCGRKVRCHSEAVDFPQAAEKRLVDEESDHGG